MDWSTAKYGSDAQNVLTNVNTAREAATEFMKERLEPEILQNYDARTEQTAAQPLTASSSLPDVQEASRGNALAGPEPGENAPSGEAHQTGSGRGEHVAGGGQRDVTLHNREHNLSAYASPPSETMTEDYRSGVNRLQERAGAAGIPENVAERVAEQRSASGETIRENDGKIDQNKTTVQASSDILRHEHQGAVKSQQIGRTEEDIRQTKPKIDDAETKQFRQKLEELRQEQKKAS